MRVRSGKIDMSLLIETKAPYFIMSSLLDEKKIEETIKRIPKISFTVLDFIEVFKVLYPEDWE
ncbi:MAG: hypothetical protein DRO00_01630 [Thermoproteota archaeon]|nr:MAG: hypothetical protein DRO00_01630 [Candidatus Korarchaeota archaeon]